LQANTLKRTLFWVCAAFFVLVSCGGAVSSQGSPQGIPTNFDQLAKSAAAAKEAGRIEEAIQEYKRALEIRTDWSEGWWYLGTMEYDADHYAEAIPAFQKLVQLSPGMAAGWDFLGLCEFETREYGNSLEHLRKAQSLGETDDPQITRVSRYHLALLLIRGGEFENATSLLAETFGQGTISPQVKTALGLALLRVPLLPEEIDPSHDALLRAGGEIAANLVEGHLAKALEGFQALIANYSKIPYVRFAYSKALAEAGKANEALQQAQEELRLSPASALPRIEISQVQLVLNHSQGALSAAKEAVRLDPNSPVARLALGKLGKQQGKKIKPPGSLKLPRDCP